KYPSMTRMGTSKTANNPSRARARGGAGTMLKTSPIVVLSGGGIGSLRHQHRPGRQLAALQAGESFLRAVERKGLEYRRDPARSRKLQHLAHLLSGAQQRANDSLLLGEWKPAKLGGGPDHDRAPGFDPSECLLHHVG